MDCHVADAPRNDMSVILRTKSEGSQQCEMLKRVQHDDNDLLTYLPTNLLTNNTLSLALSLGEGSAKKQTSPARGERRKIAFTLAEVLITLGIIGIVAAMTIPTLVSNHKKQVLETRLKYSYSLLSQVVEQSKVDYGELSTWQYEDVDYFLNTYIVPKLKTLAKEDIDNGGYEERILKIKNKTFKRYNMDFSKI